MRDLYVTTAARLPGTGPLPTEHHCVLRWMVSMGVHRLDGSHARTARELAAGIYSYGGRQRMMILREGEIRNEHLCWPARCSAFIYTLEDPPPWVSSSPNPPPPPLSRVSSPPPPPLSFRYNYIISYIIPQFHLDYSPNHHVRNISILFKAKPEGRKAPAQKILV